MRKILLFNLLLATSLFISLSQNVKAYELLPKVPSELQQLKENSHGTLEIIWSTETNTPSMLAGRLSLPSKHSPEWIAYEFLNKWRTLYGLRDPNRDMKVSKVERHYEKTIVKFQHLLFRTPVWEDWLVIEMNHEGVIERIEGTIHPNMEKQLFNRPMHPAISKKQAIEKAKSMVQGELATEPEVGSYYLATRQGTPLIYVVTLHYHMPERKITTLIHSLTGRIIEQK